MLTSTAVGTCTVTASMASTALYAGVTSAPLDVVVATNVAKEEARDTMQETLLNTSRAMLGYNPAANRLLERRGGGGQTVFLPQGTSEQGSVAFAGSLQQMVDRAGKGDSLVVPTAAVRPDAAPGAASRAAGGADIWFDGRFVWWNGKDDDDASARTFLGEAGLDYMVSDSLLIGVSVRLDWTETRADQYDSELDGRGWMVGPYIVYEIAPGLRFDGKFHWGQSDTDVALTFSNTRYSGNTAGTRWLGEAGLRGNLDLSPFLVEPGLRVAYFHAETEAFRLDNAGGEVKEQELSLLHLALDPRISYQTATDSGLALTPFISPQLVAEWQERTDRGSGWDVYGVLEAGIGVTGSGFAVNAAASASGLGSDQGTAYTARADVTIPLN